MSTGGNARTCEYANIVPDSQTEVERVLPEEENKGEHKCKQCGWYKLGGDEEGGVSEAAGSRACHLYYSLCRNRDTDMSSIFFTMQT